MKPQWARGKINDLWEKVSRDAYIFSGGSCKNCGKVKPLNKYHNCEFCDKVMLDYLPTEEIIEEPKL